MTEFTDNKKFLIINEGEYRGEDPPKYFEFPYELDNFQKYFAIEKIENNCNCFFIGKQEKPLINLDLTLKINRIVVHLNLDFCNVRITL